MFRKTLKAAVGAFNKVCNLLLGIVMVAMFLVLLLQIISRFIAFVPLPWSQDLIVFLLICSVFLGACTATANNKQIRLEFFVDLLPKSSPKSSSSLLISSALRSWWSLPPRPSR